MNHNYSRQTNRNVYVSRRPQKPDHLDGYLIVAESFVIKDFLRWQLGFIYNPQKKTWESNAPMTQEEIAAAIPQMRQACARVVPPRELQIAPGTQASGPPPAADGSDSSHSSNSEPSPAVSDPTNNWAAGETPSRDDGVESSASYTPPDNIPASLSTSHPGGGGESDSRGQDQLHERLPIKVEIMLRPISAEGVDDSVGKEGVKEARTGDAEASSPETAAAGPATSQSALIPDTDPVLLPPQFFIREFQGSEVAHTEGGTGSVVATCLSYVLELRNCGSMYDLRPFLLGEEGDSERVSVNLTWVADGQKYVSKPLKRNHAEDVVEKIRWRCREGSFAVPVMPDFTTSVGPDASTSGEVTEVGTGRDPQRGGNAVSAAAAKAINGVQPPETPDRNGTDESSSSNNLNISQNIVTPNNVQQWSPTLHPDGSVDAAGKTNDSYNRKRSAEDMALSTPADESISKRPREEGAIETVTPAVSVGVKADVDVDLCRVPNESWISFGFASEPSKPRFCAGGSIDGALVPDVLPEVEVKVGGDEKGQANSALDYLLAEGGMMDGVFAWREVTESWWTTACGNQVWGSKRNLTLDVVRTALQTTSALVEGILFRDLTGGRETAPTPTCRNHGLKLEEGEFLSPSSRRRRFYGTCPTERQACTILPYDGLSSEEVRRGVRALPGTSVQLSQSRKNKGASGSSSSSSSGSSNGNSFTLGSHGRVISSVAKKLDYGV